MNNYSIIIPVYNEDENIKILVNDILKFNKNNFEIIVVDDCSNIQIKKNIFNNNNDINVIRHETNSGQSASIYTGVLNAKYNNIITMDGDNQNDPRDISLFLDKFKENNSDLIQGIRINRKDNINKKIASKVANYIRSLILNDNCLDSACGFRFFKKDKFLKITYFDHMHRFLPYLFQRYNFKTENINVNHRNRYHGRSKYNNLFRFFAGLLDLFGVIWITRRRYKGKYEFK